MSSIPKLRDTYAMISEYQYRVRAVEALLGVSANTVKSYAANCGFEIPRASDFSPGAPAVRIFDIETVFRMAAWRREAGLSKKLACEGPIFLTTAVVKGGTAKSTTVAELGTLLQLMGLRVLLIDLDVQGSLTHIMGYESDLTLNEGPEYGVSEKAIVTHTFADLLIPYLNQVRERRAAAQWPDPASYIKRPFGEHGPAVIPGDAYLDSVVQPLVNAAGLRELNVRKFFEASKAGLIPGFNTNQFDVVIFDCPPAMSQLNSNALAAADIVISPVRMDAFAIKGLKRLMTELVSIEEACKLNPELVILPTYFAPNLPRIGRMQEQLNRYRDKVVPCSISQAELFPRSLEGYLPVVLQHPTSQSAKEYRMFAEVMYNKIMAISKERKK